LTTVSVAVVVLLAALVVAVAWRQRDVAALRKQLSEAIADKRSALLDLASTTNDLANAEAKLEHPRVTKEQRDALIAARCTHCGGSHAVNCPRLKRIRFRADGSTPWEIEYWRDDEWPKDRVTFTEDLLVDEPES
jgi:hypothetical protein